MDVKMMSSRLLSVGTVALSSILECFLYERNRSVYRGARTMIQRTV